MELRLYLVDALSTCEASLFLLSIGLALDLATQPGRFRALISSINIVTMARLIYVGDMLIRSGYLGRQVYVV